MAKYKVGDELLLVATDYTFDRLGDVMIVVALDAIRHDIVQLKSPHEKRHWWYFDSYVRKLTKLEKALK